MSTQEAEDIGFFVRPEEVLTGWLGVVIEDSNGWSWSASVMQRLARWLAERTA